MPEGNQEIYLLLSFITLAEHTLNCEVIWFNNTRKKTHAHKNQRIDRYTKTGRICAESSSYGGCKKEGGEKLRHGFLEMAEPQIA